MINKIKILRNKYYSVSLGRFYQSTRLYLLLLFLKIVNSTIFWRNINNKIPDKINKILLINPQGIGDFLVLTPTIRALKNKYKQAKLIYVSSLYAYDIVKNNQNIYKIYTYPITLIDYVKFIYNLRKEEIDLSIDFQMTVSSLSRSMIGFLSGAFSHLAYKRKGFRSFLPTHEIKWPGSHMVINYLETAHYLNCHIKSNILEVNIDDNSQQFVLELLNKKEHINKILIGIHPSTHNPLHRWSTERFIEFINKLSNSNTSIFLLGERDEQTKIISEACSGKIIDLTGRTNIFQYIAIIKKINLLISIDTSAVHVASATNTPTIALYGPTIENYWGPWNKWNQILIQKKLRCEGKCRDCDTNKIITGREICVEKENICLTEDITVKDVMLAFESLANSYGWKF